MKKKIRKYTEKESRKICILEYNMFVKATSIFVIASNYLKNKGKDPYKNVDLWFDTAEKIRDFVTVNPKAKSLFVLVGKSK